MTIYRDDLERVYALIEKPEAWTQKTYARPSPDERFDNEEDDDAEISNAMRHDATCWCLWGAALKCGIGTATAKHEDYEFVEALGFKNTSDPNIFNDSHTHAEVLQLLKDAIERAPVRP